MDEVKEKTLRREILEKTAEYYHQILEPEQNAIFTPGKTKLHYAGRIFDETELKNLVESALDFWLTSGRFTQQFEKKLAEFLGVKSALFVNSGSSANLLAFMTLTSPLLKDRRIRRGDEVITAAAGFPTTVAPILQYGAVPVFLDVDAGTANLDPRGLRTALSKKTKAVMLAHTLGNPFQIKEIKQFCEENGLWLIEDNCDALGSRFAGRLTGTWGDIGTSSFYPPHHMTTGEGGAVYMNDPLLRKIALSLRDWGRDCWCPPGCDNTCGCRFTRHWNHLPDGYDHKYVYSHFGFNLKATDMQAAIGCAQLEKLDSFIQKRKENFNRLYDGLKDLPQLRLFSRYPESDPAWFGFLMTLTPMADFTRNDFAAHLERNLIQTRNLFAGNLIRHPCFETLTEGIHYRIAEPLKHTDDFMNHALWIGVYPGMSREKLDYMIETIRSFCLGGRK